MLRLRAVNDPLTREHARGSGAGTVPARESFAPHKLRPRTIIGAPARSSTALNQ